MLDSRFGRTARDWPTFPGDYQSTNDRPLLSKSAFQPFKHFFPNRHPLPDDYTLYRLEVHRVEFCTAIVNTDRGRGELTPDMATDGIRLVVRQAIN